MQSFDDIIEFSYGSSIYKLFSTLKYEYRSYRVKNFLIFYVIDENQKMDINNILE